MMNSPPFRLAVTASLFRLRGMAFLSVAVAVLSPLSMTNASDLRRTAIVRAVENSKSAVVNIHGHKTLLNEDRDSTGSGPRRVNGMGTGVIIDARGYIVTNHHVIDGVRRIRVTLDDERTYTARMVAHDPSTDLAIIKITPSRPLDLIKIGTSGDLLTGEPVIAMGNAYGYHHTVTRGIVSALERSVQVTETQHYHDLIQTDASINPGNSGGPLLNIDGEMIGINVAVRVGAQGIGFAIPVDKVMNVVAELMSIERLEGTWHGIEGTTISGNSGARGYVVRGVRKGSPASVAGIRSGDILHRVEETNITFGADIERALIGRNPGETVRIDVRRDGQAERIEMTLARRSVSPSHQRHAAVGHDSTSPSNAANDAWEVLGMDLLPVESSKLGGVDKQYRGGLSVARVRADGPAARQGIKSGDILVGMHKWETVSLDNLEYILKQADVKTSSQVKFYIVRGSNTLYGHLPLKVR